MVHGAWHSSAHWAATQRYLVRLGLDSIAVDLPGHGVNAPIPSSYLLAGQPGLESQKSAVADVTMQDSADVILSEVTDLHSRGRRIVVVAHSAGGGPASLAAEQAPEMVDRLVYLSAFVPAGRPRFTDYINADENVVAAKIPMVGEPSELGAHRINPFDEDPTVLEAVRYAFLDDLPDDAPSGWRQLLHPDEPFSSLTAPVVVSAQRWGQIPRTYIRLTDDRALPPVTQDLMIAEADEAYPEQRFDVRDLTGGHSPFVTRPAELAALLADVALKSADYPAV
ncbi:MAG: alpha/beta hydrolase [Mycobacterium sp.]